MIAVGFVARKRDSLPSADRVCAGIEAAAAAGGGPEAVLAEACRSLTALAAVRGACAAVRGSDGGLTLLAVTSAGKAPPCPTGGFLERALGEGGVAVAPAPDGHGVQACLPVRVEEGFEALLLLRLSAPPDAALLDWLEAARRRLALALRTAVNTVGLRLHRAAVAALDEAVFVTDRQGRIEWVNPAFTRQSGYTAEEAVGETPRLLRSGRQDAALYGEMWRAIGSGAVWRGEMTERRKDGSFYQVDQTVTPVVDGGGGIRHFVAVHQDVTERRLAAERIEYLASHDALTTLPNRSLFTRQLGAMIAEAGSDSLAILFVDLDRFSRVNDSLGHDFGDRLLLSVVDRIRNCAAGAGLLARIGGDEFALVLAGREEQAATVAAAITEALVRPFDIGGQHVNIGASVGIVIYPDDGREADVLIEHADIAMYRAIHEAPNGYRFFSGRRRDDAQSRLALERDLRLALGKREFVLHYQPQVETATGRIIGFEALVRWHRPGQGLVLPGGFIPLAESGGLIIPIGEWVLREACRQVAAWEEAGLPKTPVAVNLSAIQLRQPDFLSRALRIVEEERIEPSAIELELTETMVMEDGEAAVAVLHQLGRHGFGLAIDDFGIGYSSLNYLKRFPVDKLKVDRSFVRDLAHDSSSAEIARAIITLGHSLGLKVVAEGVETEQQFQCLRGEGSDVVQGFLFSPAVAADVAADQLASRAFERTPV